MLTAAAVIYVYISACIEFVIKIYYLKMMYAHYHLTNQNYMLLLGNTGAVAEGVS